jgi:DNA-binding response OmpR family regulator
MDKQYLIIFKFQSLYEIASELEESLNFKILKASSEKSLNDKLNSVQNCLIVTQKKINNLNNQFILNHLPIKLSNLIEKINIEFLKIQYNKKSELNIGRYNIDLNSRELTENNVVLKLTEKETNIIIFLFKSNNTVGVAQLQSKVWGHNSKLETHTVETHIYRLRKKILKTFNDDKFIVSKKNGYQIN